MMMEYAIVNHCGGELKGITSIKEELVVEFDIDE
jgi:hypothetical protein